MNQKYKHIVTVGTSPIVHYEREHKRKPDRASELAELIRTDPRKYSAELKALLPFVDRNECHTVHLVGSDTPDGRLAREALGQWLHNKGIHQTSAAFDPPNDKEEADSYMGLFNLILKAAKKEENQIVLINATGGFKGQCITAALAARLLNLPAYYIFESMESPVFLPTIQPSESQYKQLRLLKERTSFTDRAGLSADDLIHLEHAGLVILQRQVEGDISAIKLSAYADFLLRQPK